MVHDLLDQLVAQNEFDKIFILDNTDSNIKYNLFKYQNDKLELVSTTGLKIYEQWNLGFSMAKNYFPDSYVVVLNDDLILRCDNFLSKLVSPLIEDENVWASCGNYDSRISEYPYIDIEGTYKNNGFAGFCFALSKLIDFNGEDIFETNYNWWYGDDDLVHSVHKYGKRVVMSIEALMTHIDNGSKSVDDNTPEFNEMVGKDHIYYMNKWN
jgi:GT2 family glycosyltransferase